MSKFSPNHGWKPNTNMDIVRRLLDRHPSLESVTFEDAEIAEEPMVGPILLNARLVNGIFTGKTGLIPMRGCTGKGGSVVLDLVRLSKCDFQGVVIMGDLEAEECQLSGIISGSPRVVVRNSEVNLISSTGGLTLEDCVVQDGKMSSATIRGGAINDGKFERCTVAGPGKIVEGLFKYCELYRRDIEEGTFLDCSAYESSVYGGTWTIDSNNPKRTDDDFRLASCKINGGQFDGINEMMPKCRIDDQSVINGGEFLKVVVSKCTVNGGQFDQSIVGQTDVFGGLFRKCRISAANVKWLAGAVENTVSPSIPDGIYLGSLGPHSQIAGDRRKMIRPSSVGKFMSIFGDDYYMVRAGISS